MSKTYRVDYACDDQPERPIVFQGLTRAKALRKAAQASTRRGVGLAYAIATNADTGRDTGQRVYSGGAFSHQDDDF